MARSLITKSLGVTVLYSVVAVMAYVTIPMLARLYADLEVDPPAITAALMNLPRMAMPALLGLIGLAALFKDAIVPRGKTRLTLNLILGLLGIAIGLGYVFLFIHGYVGVMQGVMDGR